MKLVYTPLNIPFLKTLVTNLLFSGNIFTSRKESDLFISVSIENFMFLCFLYIYSRKNCTFSGLLNKKKKKIIKKKNYPLVFCNKQVCNLSGNLSANYFHDNKEKY